VLGHELLEVLDRVVVLLAFMYVRDEKLRALSSSGLAARYFLKCSIDRFSASWSFGWVEPVVERHVSHRHEHCRADFARV